MAPPKTKNKKERDEQRAKFMSLYKSGVSKYRIAKMFGCHETNVGSIINKALANEKQGN